MLNETLLSPTKIFKKQLIQDINYKKVRNKDSAHNKLAVFELVTKLQVLFMDFILIILFFIHNEGTFMDVVNLENPDHSTGS
ncbi:hypothetical protein DGG96_09425 [Legionella qingyii]|uniref:Uncharacterized protein n=1 Tax=Legionella qingyii TaxID=2184757 RepID=A0A317U3X4_9GAMM|nr:hypothetical protein DGG96_09425 [Legionella qingyii]